MRKWMNLFEERWFTTLESKTFGGANHIEVFVNPTPNDMKKMYGARMMLGKNGDLYYWDENTLHSEIDTQLNKISPLEAPHLYCTDSHSLCWNEIEAYKLDHAWDRDLNFDGNEIYYSKRLRNDWQTVISNPNVQRLMGGDNFTIYGTDEHYPVFDMTPEWIARNVEA